MRDASEKLDQQAGINRTNKAQFAEPIREMLYLTHTFLCGCENLNTLDTKEKLNDFESYLHEQPQHRFLLMKRLPGSRNSEYQELNAAYADEMETLEREEIEAARNRKS